MKPRIPPAASPIVVAAVALAFAISCRESNSDYICVVDAKFPTNSVSPESPEDLYERVHTGTAKRRFPNVIDVQKACLKRPPEERQSACALLRTPKARKWTAQIRAAFAEEVHILDSSNSLVRFVETVGRRVEQQSGLRCVERIEFLVYEADDGRAMNAFALPGGTVAIGSTLLRKINESELAVILGHEIAHVQTVTLAPELQSLFGKQDGILDTLRHLREKAGAVCRGPMSEAYVDFFGTQWARSAGYDPYAGARLFSIGPLNDGKTAADYDPVSSHPPSGARATWAAYAAGTVEPAGRWQWHGIAYFRGNLDASQAWDGRIPPEVERRCANGK